MAVRRSSADAHAALQRAMRAISTNVGVSNGSYY